MNREYDEIIRGIAIANGGWFEVNSSQLTGGTLLAKRNALSQAAKVRGVKIQTSLKDGFCRARLASGADTADLAKRVVYARRFHKRVQLKKITDAKWFRVNKARESFAVNINVLVGRYGLLYMLAPEYPVPDCVKDLVVKVNLYTAMTARDEYYILYVPNRNDRWYRTGMAAIRRAVNEWIHVTGDVTHGYVATTVTASQPIPEPDWSKVPSFDQLIDSAFRDRIIRNGKHPALPELLGLPESEEI